MLYLQKQLMVVRVDMHIKKTGAATPVFLFRLAVSITVDRPAICKCNTMLQLP